MTSGKGPMLPQVKTQKRVKLIPPDGGWGWMVLLGTATSNVSFFIYRYARVHNSLLKKNSDVFLLLLYPTIKDSIKVDSIVSMRRWVY